MKYLLILSIGLFLLSCNTTKTTLDPVLKKKVKIYEHSNFTFHYPMSWEKFSKKENTNDGILIRIAPFELIYSIPDNPHAKKKTYNYYYQNSKTDFNISKEKMKYTSMEAFFSAREFKRIDNNKGETKLKSEITPQTPAHYIEILEISDNKPDNDYKILNQNHIIHYRLHNNYLYRIIFSSIPEEISKIYDAELMFRTFRFKKMLATPHQKP